MERIKKLVMLSHCVINQNSVVYPLARAKGPFTFVDELIKNNVGIYQLPCPEFKFGGLNRVPTEKEDYDTPEYRGLCKKLAKEVVCEILEYIKHNNKVVGVIGINHSPTCSISGKRGIFMEELFTELENNNIILPFVEVPGEYDESNDSVDEMREKIKEMIK